MRWLPSLLAVSVTACGSGVVDTVHDGPPDTPDDTSALVSAFPTFDGERPKNVLLLSIDTVRKHHLTRYGGTTALPFLEQLQATGVPLDDHISCSNWTYPSLVCALGGRDNVDMSFIPELGSATREPMPEGLGTLAGWLGEQGYRSAVVSSNSWFGVAWNTTEGYDVTAEVGHLSAVEIAQIGIALVAEPVANDDPWLLHLHVIEPHSTYIPPEAYLADLAALAPIAWDLADDDDYATMREVFDDLPAEEQALILEHAAVRYRGELQYVDDMLSEIWSMLEAADMIDGTLVVLFSDHGEQFEEHGSQTHAYDLYREENDAVALLWAENIVPQAWSGPTSHIDLVPTVLGIAAVPIPPEVTGYPVGAAPAGRARFATAAARFGVIQSVLVDDMKLRYDWGGSRSFHRWADDPDELGDAYDADDPDVLRLWDLLLPQVVAATPLIDVEAPVDPGP
jgi:arylsulfatase A-like enzyme